MPIALKTPSRCPSVPGPCARKAGQSASRCCSEMTLPSLEPASQRIRWDGGIRYAADPILAPPLIPGTAIRPLLLRPDYPDFVLGGRSEEHTSELQSLAY